MKTLVDDLGKNRHPFDVKRFFAAIGGLSSRLEGASESRFRRFLAGASAPAFFCADACVARSLTLPKPTRSGIAGPSSHSIWLSGDGGPFPIQEHHAPQRASGRPAGQDLHQADPRNHHRGAARRGRSQRQSAPAGGDDRGARKQYDARHHRSRHQARLGLGRRRQLRRGPLRGLWPGRRGADRRGADQQPQSYGGRGPLELQQIRRQSRRDQQRVLHVRPAGRVPLSAQRSARPTRCWTRQSMPAPTMS